MTTDELKIEMEKALARTMVELIRARHSSRLCYLAGTLKDKMAGFQQEAKENNSNAIKNNGVRLIEFHKAHPEREVFREQAQKKLFNATDHINSK